MKPLPIQDLFQWNVSLVERLGEQSGEPGTQAAQALEPAPQAVVRPKQPVTSTSQAVPARKSNPGLTERQQRVVETTSVMERSPDLVPPPAAVQQHQESVIQMDAIPANSVTRLEEAQHVEPAPNPTVQSMVSEEPPSRVDVGTPVRQASPDGDKASPLDAAEPVQMAAIPKESGISQAPSEPPQPVVGTVRPTPAGRPDYGWLIESVSKRLAELKRYPATARSNGLEGKVLLRAVIRADGQLAEVTVQKSSGYEELDMAAMETIREASPLQMRHELGRAQIAITVPLVYSLAR
jgi:protein TonB